MKKTLKILLALVIALINFTSTVSANSRTYNTNSITGKDKEMYGDTYDEIIVVYDISINYFNPLYINASDASPFASIPGTDAGGQAFCYNYFSKIAWVTRDGIVSLALTPKVDTVLFKAKNWEAIYNLFSDDPQWKNSGNPTVDSSMENQFACHYDGQSMIPEGDDWNLEPHREDVGYFSFVLNECNPD